MAKPNRLVLTQGTIRAINIFNFDLIVLVIVALATAGKRDYQEKN